MEKKIALGIIDAQRGFMPAEEGERVGQAGFGELPVDNGQKIVSKVNRLVGVFARKGAMIFTTQDWHPRETAHFATEPNYKTTWPVHCVADTPGAELHPGIYVPAGTYQIRKGTQALARGEDDTSYSAYNGGAEDGESLANILRGNKVDAVVLGGLALDYCVGLTAIDLRNEIGLDVIVAIDATRAIAEESGQAMLDRFAQNGIRTLKTDQAVQLVEAR